MRRVPARRSKTVTTRAGFWETNPTGLNKNADDAARKAAESWLNLDKSQYTAAAATAAEQYAKRVALEAEAKQRDAETNAHLWETRAKNVRGDLEEAQKQLTEFRAALVEFTDQQPDLEAMDNERALAVAAAEIAARKADQAQRELDEVRGLARQAAKDGGARIAAAEKRATELERGVEFKNAELVGLKRNLESDIESLRVDLASAKAMGNRREDAVAAAARDRDKARRMVGDRENKLRFAEQSLAEAKNLFTERERERDEARSMVYERDARLRDIDAALGERARERDEARAVADRRYALVDERERERDEARNMVREKEQALAQHLKERDEARRMVEERDLKLTNSIRERDEARAVADKRQALVDEREAGLQAAIDKAAGGADRAAIDKAERAQARWWRTVM